MHEKETLWRRAKERRDTEGQKHRRWPRKTGERRDKSCMGEDRRKKKNVRSQKRGKVMQKKPTRVKKGKNARKGNGQKSGEM